MWLVDPQDQSRSAEPEADALQEAALTGWQAPPQQHQQASAAGEAPLEASSAVLTQQLTQQQLQAALAGGGARAQQPGLGGELLLQSLSRQPRAAAPQRRRSVQVHHCAA